MEYEEITRSGFVKFLEVIGFKQEARNHLNYIAYKKDNIYIGVAFNSLFRNVFKTTEVEFYIDYEKFDFFKNIVLNYINPEPLPKEKTLIEKLEDMGFRNSSDDEVDFLDKHPYYGLNNDNSIRYLKVHHDDSFCDDIANPVGLSDEEILKRAQTLIEWNS